METINQVCDAVVLEQMDDKLTDIIDKVDDLKRQMLDCSEFDNHSNKWEAINRLNDSYRYLKTCRFNLSVD